jgi:hypothetical protein
MAVSQFPPRRKGPIANLSATGIAMPAIASWSQLTNAQMNQINTVFVSVHAVVIASARRNSARNAKEEAAQLAANADGRE